MYVVSKNLLAEKSITYSKLVGISKAVLASFMYALLPLHRRRFWCLKLSVHGVSSTRGEAKVCLKKM